MDLGMPWWTALWHVLFNINIYYPLTFGRKGVLGWFLDVKMADLDCDRIQDSKIHPWPVVHWKKKACLRHPGKPQPWRWRSCPLESRQVEVVAYNLAMSTGNVWDKWDVWDENSCSFWLLTRVSDSFGVTSGNQSWQWSNSRHLQVIFHSHLCTRVPQPWFEWRHSKLPPAAAVFAEPNNHLLGMILIILGSKK